MFKNKITLGLFILALLIQVGILFSFQVIKEKTIETGKKIIVKTVPVDPRSLFRGDYVILNYAFSQIDREVVEEKIYGKLKHNKKLYVKLSGDEVTARDRLLTDETIEERKWQVTSVSDRVFKQLKPNEIMLAGNIDSWSDKSISIFYGVESYFVPEGTGLAIEEKTSSASIKVLLAVNKKGHAVVMKFFIEGQEVQFDNEETEEQDQFVK